MNGRLSTLLSGAILLAVCRAEAQIDNGLPGPQPLDVGALMLNRQLLSGIMDHNQEVRDGGAKHGVSPNGVLTYRRDPAISKRVERSYLARAQKAYGPKVADGLRRFLASNDFVSVWAKGAAGDGMRPNDLGDSLAEYWTTNWAIAQGLNATTPAQTKAVRFQIGPVVARMPAIRRLSAAQKQEISEGLMLNLVVVALGAQTAQRQGDPAPIAKLRQATAARFRQDFGVDLNAVKITGRGLVRG